MVIDIKLYSKPTIDFLTGLYKYGARYYNVAEERWTQPDLSGYISWSNAVNGALSYGQTGAIAGSVGGWMCRWCIIVTVLTFT